MPTIVTAARTPRIHTHGDWAVLYAHKKKRAFDFCFWQVALSFVP